MVYLIKISIYRLLAEGETEEEVGGREGREERGRTIGLACR